MRQGTDVYVGSTTRQGYMVSPHFSSQTKPIFLLFFDCPAAPTRLSRRKILTNNHAHEGYLRNRKLGRNAVFLLRNEKSRVAFPDKLHGHVFVSPEKCLRSTPHIQQQSIHYAICQATARLNGTTNQGNRTRTEMKTRKYIAPFFCALFVLVSFAVAACEYIPICIARIDRQVMG